MIKQGFLFHTKIKRLLNAVSAPIVNENDSVSCDGIRFGGNDTLSAYVAIACDADIIINLSDIDGLYTADPRKDKSATFIDRVDAINDEVIAYAGGAGSERGTGGMLTKIMAAKIATENGIPMIILNGENPRILYDILDGKHVGTYFAKKK